METKKVYIRSFGCQMNKLDSALVVSALKGAGFEQVESVEDADVVLINTCSVREHAEAKVFSHLGNLKYLKESKPELVVAVAGCMAQRLGDELLEHEAVDIVVGPGQIGRIPSLVEEALGERHKAIAVTENIRTGSGEAESEELDRLEAVYDSNENNIPGQAFVRAMRGCNNFCTYCVVPYVRGPEVSRPPDAVIEQVKRLVDKGIKQVTLLGQTINAYKYSAGDKTYGLADLLEMVSEVDGVKWLRFVTSHPRGFDESILHAMADIEKVCPYLHIPAQSGSDRILKAMNRGYTAAEYLSLLDKAREINPGVSIASDFIVGFPGETEEDFDATVELVKKAEYKNCFVFKYSPRPGTRAIKKLRDDVSEDVKKRRNTELLAVQTVISEEYNKRYLGQVVTVLVEGLSKKPHLNKAENEGHPQLIGRTGTDHIVVFNGPESLAGEFANVRVVKTAPLTLFGDLE